MKQFIIDKEPDNDGIIRLDGKDYRYLVRVRRLTAGKSFPALLPSGEETLIKILSIDKNILIGKCAMHNPVSQCEESSQTLPSIILVQALPKGDKMDLIVRQAVESGISEIIPIVSEFSVGKAHVGEKKFSRWERIIKEARQQSGSKIATTIRRPLLINEFFEYWTKIQNEGEGSFKENIFGVIFHHQGVEKNSLHEYLYDNPKIVTAAIGPEGGFSDTEVSLFLEKGFKTFTIGDTILRTETAALYCTAAVKIILLERDTWELNKIQQ
ncbi:MAG: 16S rRNA (uracil(1498)-N(3))-methyltransferase [Treponema sp.]|nr:16S rRNA (uracil(1498)-N(3))-methyltransferase [Treponema sp.]